MMYLILPVARISFGSLWMLATEEMLLLFFYHTLMDWYHPDYKNNFPAYLKYLRESVEMLCENHGKISTICWLDNGKQLPFRQDGEKVTVQTEPYRYGRSLVVRVAKITVEL